MAAPAADDNYLKDIAFAQECAEGILSALASRSGGGGGDDVAGSSSHLFNAVSTLKGLINALTYGGRPEGPNPFHGFRWDNAMRLCQRALSETERAIREVSRAGADAVAAANVEGGPNTTPRMSTPRLSESTAPALTAPDTLVQTPSCETYGDTRSTLAAADETVPRFAPGEQYDYFTEETRSSEARRLASAVESSGDATANSPPSSTTGTTGVSFSCCPFLGLLDGWALDEVLDRLPLRDLARSSASCRAVRSSAERVLLRRRARRAAAAAVGLTKKEEKRQPLAAPSPSGSPPAPPPAAVSAAPGRRQSGEESLLSLLVWEARLAGQGGNSRIAVGGRHGVAVHAESGDVSVWGRTWDGSIHHEIPGLLGRGIEEPTGENPGLRPHVLPGLSDVVSVSCSDGHTLALTERGEVYAWGSGEWGQCGGGPGRCKFTHFAGGPFEGEVVGADVNTIGQLGRGYIGIDVLYYLDGEDDEPMIGYTDFPACPVPTTLGPGVTMRDYYRLCARTAAGRGSGRGWLPDFRARAVAGRGWLPGFPPLFVVPVPTPLAVPSSRRVLRVSAGSYHSLFLGEDGLAYSVGCGLEGRLGHGNEESLTVPRAVVGGDLGSPPGGTARRTAVVDVAAGTYHSLAVRADGRAVAFGRPSMLGRRRGGAASGLLPVVVDEDVAFAGAGSGGPPRKFVNASAGVEHSLLVDDGGAAYSYGVGFGGRLGHGTDESDRDVPTQIAALDGVRIEAVSAGHGHSLAMSDDGTVYVFGREDGFFEDDEFGFDVDDEEDLGRPRPPRGEPTVRTIFGGKGKATDIAAGPGSSAVLSGAGLDVTNKGGCGYPGLAMSIPSWPKDSNKE